MASNRFVPRRGGAGRNRRLSPRLAASCRRHPAASCRQTERAAIAAPVHRSVRIIGTGHLFLTWWYLVNHVNGSRGELRVCNLVSRITAAITDSRRLIFLCKRRRLCDFGSSHGSSVSEYAKDLISLSDRIRVEKSLPTATRASQWVTRRRGTTLSRCL